MTLDDPPATRATHPPIQVSGDSSQKELTSQGKQYQRKTITGYGKERGMEGEGIRTKFFATWPPSSRCLNKHVFRPGGVCYSARLKILVLILSRRFKKCFDVWSLLFASSAHSTAQLRCLFSFLPSFFSSLLLDLAESANSVNVWSPERERRREERALEHIVSREEAQWLL